MVFTKSQTENMSRERLCEQLLKLLDGSSKLSDLNSFEKFNNRGSKYDKVYSKTQKSRNCNSHLLQRTIQLERNAVRQILIIIEEKQLK